MTALAAVQETGELVLVEFTQHVVDRYCERVRPGIDRRRALLELQAHASAFPVAANRPTWASSAKAGLWLSAGPDVAFLLEPSREDSSRLVARTCLTRII